jgi:hypothetical protein
VAGFVVSVISLRVFFGPEGIRPAEPIPVGDVSGDRHVFFHRSWSWIFLLRKVSAGGQELHPWEVNSSTRATRSVPLSKMIGESDAGTSGGVMAVESPSAQFAKCRAANPATNAVRRKRRDFIGNRAFEFDESVL